MIEFLPETNELIYRTHLKTIDGYIMHVVIYPSNGYFVLCPLFFTQLSEDAASALGMQEGDF